MFTCKYFQIQHSVSSKHVLLLSELLKIGEKIAMIKLQKKIISKDSYSNTVMMLKKRFISGLLKHQNKEIKYIAVILAVDQESKIQLVKSHFAIC